MNYATGEKSVTRGRSAPPFVHVNLNLGKHRYSHHFVKLLNQPNFTYRMY